jgi:hypothetical protein
MIAAELAVPERSRRGSPRPSLSLSGGQSWGPRPATPNKKTKTQKARPAQVSGNVLMVRSVLAGFDP